MSYKSTAMELQGEQGKRGLVYGPVTTVPTRQNTCTNSDACSLTTTLRYEGRCWLQLAGQYDTGYYGIEGLTTLTC